VPERFASIGVVGSANADVIVRCHTLPRPGETILGGDLLLVPGGKGANQACAASALGGSVEFIGAVGNDGNGELLRESFAKHGVGTSFLRSSSQPTGTALIAVEDSGENLIVVAPGANNDVSLEAVDWSKFDVVISQMEIQASVVLEAARSAKRFILNAAPISEIADELLSECDVLIVNETEAQAINLNRVPFSVVTYGKNGAACFEFGSELVRAAAPRVDVVDSVGAGDTFVAAYALRFALGESPTECLHYAVIAGALATLNPGAQGAPPTHEEVLTWLLPA
jgi:ribokinase